MSLAPPTYLIDGPLMGAPARRAAVKAKMVLALMEANTFDRDSARRELYAQDFLPFDIELLVEEARAEAAAFAALTDAIANLMATP